MSLGLIFLAILFAMPFALASGIRLMVRCGDKSERKMPLYGRILFAAFLVALVMTVVPHWLNRGGEVYNPALLLTILVYGNLFFLIASKLIGKFGDEYGLPFLNQIAAGAMLAIPMTFGVLMLLNGRLIRYFGITLTN